MSLFNLKTYKTMMTCAQRAGYKFISFSDIRNKPKIPNHDFVDKKGHVLLRHDVDADLSAAADMAREEQKLGIQATYFLMWRSPCYNLMSRSSQNFIESILKMGHHIGLHYDQGFDALRNVPPNKTVKFVEQQAKRIEEWLGCPVSAVSFHQPSRELLKTGVDCGERINTYDKKRLKEFRYISDSNRKFPLWESESSWPPGNTLSEALAKLYPLNIQLLIHPMWWVYEEPSTEEVWDRVLIMNFEQAQNQLVETEGAYGAKRRIQIARTDKK